MATWFGIPQWMREMTTPASNAWFPLGGHNLTAHSSNVALTPGQGAQWVQIQQAQLNQAEMLAAQVFNSTAAQQMVGLQQAAAQQGTVFSSTSGGFTSGFVQLGAAAVIKASTDATARSMELFYEWLTEDQRKMLCVRDCIEVVGGDTGRRYRIYAPAPYNIHKLCKDSDETEHKLCFVPKDQNLPKGDIWLCQKLALELDERNTLDIANHQVNHCAY